MRPGSASTSAVKGRSGEMRTVWPTSRRPNPRVSSRPTYRPSRTDVAYTPAKALPPLTSTFSAKSSVAFLKPRVPRTGYQKSWARRTWPGSIQW